MLDIINNATGFISELGTDVIRSNLEEMHNEKQIRADIEQYIAVRQGKEFSEGYTIDYERYLCYIRGNMINEIKAYIFTIDYEIAKRLESTILAKAEAYALNEHYSVSDIRTITQNCINIVKSYYEGKLDGNDKLLGHLTVQTILETISPQINDVSENVKEIANEVVSQGNQRSAEYVALQNKLEEIQSQLQQSENLCADSEFGSSFMLVFCEEDSTFAEELKIWLNSKGVEYSEYCYKEDINNDDVIAILNENVLSILIVGKKFLKNVNCVYCLDQKLTSKNMESKIIPVVVDSSIFTHENRIKLISYWEQKEKELREMIAGLDRLQHAYKLIAEDLVKCERISQTIDELIDTISKKHYPIGINQAKEVLKKNFMD